MKFEIDYSSRPFNFKRASLILFGFSLLFLVFRMYLSYDNYRNYNPHEVEVTYYKHKIKSERRKIENGELYTTAKTVYRVQSKNYAQHLILEFNPTDQNPLSLFFCFNFFVIASILGLGARKSSEEKIFTKELLNGLKFLTGYIIFMMISKTLLEFYFQDYVKKISNEEVTCYAFFSGNFFVYQISVGIIGLFINFVKKGIELQQEQDLTV